MSDRDRELLQLAGLSVPKAAGLLGRSRQAFYLGLKQPIPYLSTSDLVVLVLDAKRRDVSNFCDLVKFIDEHYSADPGFDKSLVQPSEIGIGQLLTAASRAEKVILLMNRSDAHLRSGSILMRTISKFVAENSAAKIRVLVPTDKIGDELKRIFPIPAGQIFRYRRLDTDVPTIMILDSHGAVRAFGLMASGIEEISEQDKETLLLGWQDTFGS